MRKKSKKIFSIIAFSFICMIVLLFYSRSFLWLMSNILSENEKKFFICSQNSLQKNIEKYTNILKEKDIFLKNIAFGKQGITQLTSEKTIENELLENLNNKISNLEKSRSSLQDKVKNLNDFIAVHCENKKSIKKTECRKKRRDLLKKESALK